MSGDGGQSAQAGPRARELDALAEAIAVMDQLRDPGGCPWDREQTHASLAPYAIEEAYELAEAAEDADSGELVAELGDLLLQVLFHARIGREEGIFSLEDVATRLSAKLTSRHPHVFGDVDAPDAQTVVANWDAIKATEPGREHFLDGIPRALPALARAQKVLGRAERVGGLIGDPPNPAPTGEAAPADGTTPEDLGARLFDIVTHAHHSQIDAEAALRDHLRRLEATLRSRADRADPS